MRGQTGRSFALLAAAAAALLALWPEPAHAGHGARRHHHAASFRHGSKVRSAQGNRSHKASQAQRPARPSRASGRVAAK
jgi:hypothetical protein